MEQGMLVKHNHSRHMENVHSKCHAQWGQPHIFQESSVYAGVSTAPLAFLSKMQC